MLVDSRPGHLPAAIAVCHTQPASQRSCIFVEQLLQMQTRTAGAPVFTCVGDVRAVCMRIWT